MSNRCGVTLTQNIHHKNKWTENTEPCRLYKKKEGGGVENGNVVSEKWFQQ
jgi:hypothetical protein